MFPSVFYIFFLIILIIIIVSYFVLIRPQKRVYDIFRAQDINGEPFRPLLGQIKELRRYRKADMLMNFYEDLNKKHGNILLFGVGPVVRLMVTEPDIIADVLSRHNAQYYIKPPVFTDTFKSIVGTLNLLMTEGKEHERARRMINPAFYHNNLKSLISIITDRTAKTIDSFLLQSNSKQVDLAHLFNTLTLSIIASSAFGVDLETNTNAKHMLFKVFVDIHDAIVYRLFTGISLVPFLTKLPFWKKDVIDDGARVMAKFVEQIIIDRREGRSRNMSDGPDLLDLLLSAVDEHGQPFTDQEVKDHALSFVLAGSETAGHLMVWIYYILMTHEDVLKACQEEVDRVLPNGIPPANEHLADLVVCEAVINETLRLYPPAPIIIRHCTKEHTVGTQRQLRIPAGGSIFINTYVLHHRSDLWPRSLEFDYTRWIRDSKTGLKPKLPHPYAYLPFAAGPRNCIGQNFALLEAKIMLAMFVQRCHMKLVPGQKIVPDVRITMKAKYGVLVNISKR